MGRLPALAKRRTGIEARANLKRGGHWNGNVDRRSQKRVYGTIVNGIRIMVGLGVLQRPVSTWEERRYQRELRRRVDAAWAEGKRDLQSICRRADGAFPLDVVETARTVIGARLDLSNLDKSHIEAAAGLPEPVLIDFDWRFDASSARYLARTASRCGRVLCVGTPTVFLQLTDIRADSVLVDRNVSLVRRQRF
jgi:hypothetical protein